MSRSFKKKSFRHNDHEGLGAGYKNSWHRQWRHSNKIKLNSCIDVEKYQDIYVYSNYKSYKRCGDISMYKRFYKDSRGSLKKDLYFFRNMQKEPYDLPFYSRSTDGSLKNYKRSIHKFWGK